MSTLVFVLFWVVIALALLFIAMSGGSKAARDKMQKQSRRSRQLSIMGFAAVLLVLGVLIPGLVIAAVSDDSGIPQAGVAELTPMEQRGRTLFAEQCAMCHTLEAAAAQANVGPNLDELRPPAGLTLDAIQNGRARGNGAMAPDLVVGQDAEAVAQFVARAVGQSTTTE